MFMIQSIKTDAGLLKKLKNAASKPVSLSDIKAQRVSFVFSIVGHRGVSRKQIQEVLTQGCYS